MADQNEVAGMSDTDAGVFILRLFITGASPNSIRAVENIKAICEEHLAGNYQLEIIDIHQQPQLAEGDDVIAVPLMIKKAPYPERRMIGDMSDTQRVLRGLGIAHNS
ncbi:MULTISPECIES: circadian clock KaiB family protein [unclassified Mucilaginibacter]|uniref:circadian clock KaiB family protein n=1 Tax=unclassified Mucilaginibacter TaxID=2617802 RepID=UPI00138D0C10|nr:MULTISPECIES: circadian clock KaiB family protein [unclassified Mucilaginibacter]MBB5395504.1 circadian clock protein KaiB [Mucilaginibacter sp. AK015]QHS56187.1 circadian clock protein KaiB [Mucilaginibacter sp. 14171R-50]